jgi:glutaminyl-tRNA synthetase
MYDFAHGYSDAIEGVTHSICTLEFENHRPLYDWFLDEVPFDPRPPHQIEFARLNLTYTDALEAQAAQLVEGSTSAAGTIRGCPRSPGCGGAGTRSEAIRAFCDRIGVSKRNSFVDVTLLEHAVREDLNARCRAPWASCDRCASCSRTTPRGRRLFDAPWHPEDPSQGGRTLPFSRVLYVDRDDFAEVPPKGWFRLSPGGEVRLRTRASSSASAS